MRRNWHLVARIATFVTVLCTVCAVPAKAQKDANARSTAATSKVAANGYLSLAIDSDGGVWDWGLVYPDPLGAVAATMRRIPVKVEGLNGASMASGGTYFRIVLKSDGTVWTWGDNIYGQLGDGTTTGRDVPMAVPGLTGVVAVAGGAFHALAVKSDGTVWSWGQNTRGALGDGTQSHRSTPVQVVGLTGVTTVAAGEGFSLALKADGTVWSWGSNLYMQLGDGTTDTHTVPIQVPNLTGVTALAAGRYHSLAVTASGGVQAWGRNDYGQLGNWITGGAPLGVPFSVSGLSGVKSVAGGGFHSVAIKTDGTVWTWGRNSEGQLGDGTRKDRNTAAPLSGVAGAVAVASGYTHCLVLMSDGRMVGWGDNGAGQLGNGRTPHHSIPVAVSGLTGVTAVAAGANHSLTLKSDGTLWAWGDNTYGQLGDGTTADRTLPTQVSALTEVSAVSAGRVHNLAVKGDGTVWAWGYNNAGRLGDGTTFTRSKPVQVNGLTGVVAVSAGHSHSLALKSDGTVMAWGDNTSGQLGDGTTTSRGTPAPVSGLSGVVAVVASIGSPHSLALKSDGTVWGWGDNTIGQLGDGTATDRTLPVQVKGLTAVTAVGAGTAVSWALKNDGTYWIWGDYPLRLQEGEFSNPYLPVQLRRFTGVVGVGTGAGLALRADGTVWAWGINNDLGQLGDGTTTERTTAVTVSGLTGVVALTGGLDHRLALKSDGTVMAWGGNYNGELGDGTCGSEITPTAVAELGAPDLTIEKTHSSSFVAGGGASYTITVKNGGSTATSGVVAVTDTLPSGLTNPNAFGDNWTCSVSGQTVTCTNPATLQPGAASAITLRVDVGSNAIPGVTNVATVSNSSDTSPYNNSTGDPLFVTGDGCAYSVSPPAATLPLAGGSARFAVQTGANCSWAVVGLPSWITITGGSTGTGAGMVTLAVAASNGITRSANVIIAGLSVAVTQTGGTCSYVLSATGQYFSASGGAGSVDLATSDGCQWTASSSSPWVTVIGAGGGAGNGQIQFQAAANDSGAARSTSLVIAGIGFMVQQAGPLPANAVFAGALPQVASGAGWKTTFTIMNTGTSSVAIRLNFWGDDGKELSLPMSSPQFGAGDLIQGATLERTLDAGATLLIESAAPPTGPVRVGWAELTSTGPVSGLAVFLQRSADGREQEAAVPLESRTASGYLLQFDNTAGYSTGIAAANQTAGSLVLSVTQRDDAGNHLSTETISIPAKGHTSFDLKSRWPGLAGRRGTIEVRGAAAGSFSILGLRFHPQGPFTTLPVAGK